MRHADIALDLLGDFPHQTHRLDVFLDGAVGEVDPDDVDASQDQSPQGIRSGRRRSEGRDDLGGTGEVHGGAGRVHLPIVLQIVSAAERVG
jgi:hypothetical protein